MLDLFDLAKANAVRLQEWFGDATKADTVTGRTIGEFASWILANASVTINMPLHVLAEIVIGGRYLNTNEWAEKTSRLCGRPVEELLRARLGKTYEARTEFERAFNDGKQFIYGALTAGRAGLTEYAPYCLVLQSSFQDSLDRLAYLPGDSLVVCFTSEGSFDEENTKCIVATHELRHIVATKAVLGSLPTVGPADWPSLLVTKRQYIEAIFIGDVSQPDVAKVQMLESDHSRLWALAYESFGRKLTDAEKALAHDFGKLREAELDGELLLERIA